jgi:integrase
LPRLHQRLNALSISRAKKPGMYADGDGLYLQVTHAGARSWIFRYTMHGRQREMGLGSALTLSLAEAREKAGDARRLKANGIDPIDAKRSEKAAAAAEASRQVTFEQACEAYIAAHAPGWRNAKHGQQWRNTLKTYAYPMCRSVPVSSIDTGVVMKILGPIWSDKTETANRVRGRMEAILDWARTRGHRHGENPARWRGHLENLLPKRGKVQKVEHHSSLSYDQVPEFMAKLRKQEGVAACALQFLMLTAARTGEVIGATWSEIDLKKGIWTVPAQRIKAGKEHRVPLQPAAIRLLEQVAPLKGKHDFVFPGGKKDKPLSNGAFLALLERMGRGDITAHGFRSSFRTWAGEQTTFPREVIEAALAHAIGDKVEAAYLHSDFFGKRRELMLAWAEFCGGPKAGKPKPKRHS